VGWVSDMSLVGQQHHNGRFSHVIALVVRIPRPATSTLKNECWSFWK
jgi:hypothetical protein